MDIYKNVQIHFPNVFLMFFQQGFYGCQAPILTVLSFFIFDHRKVVLYIFPMDMIIFSCGWYPKLKRITMG